MGKSIVRDSTQPARAIAPLRNCISRGLTHLKAEATLVLACGRRPDSETPGGRDHILEYAQRHLKKLQFFMAEQVFEAFQGKGTLDLLTLEKRLSEFCDCVLIVLESESTYAELGAFALEDKLIKNLLVINDIAFQNSKSFIALGPIAKINAVSRFRPVIHANLASILKAIPQVSQRLDKIEKKYNRRVDISTYARFSEVSSKVRMLFLLDTINMFQPLTHKELIDILKTYFGEESFDIHLELDMLLVLKLARRTAEEYLCCNERRQFYFSYPGIDVVALRAIVVNHYHKYFKARTPAAAGGLHYTV